MYKVKSIYSGFEDISVKCSMYKIAPLSSFTASSQCPEVELQNSDLTELTKRHSDILEKLELIQRKLEGLKIKSDRSQVKPHQNGVPKSDDGSGCIKEGGCQEVVVKCDPEHPPWVLLPAIAAFRKEGISVMCSSSTHSSLLPSPALHSAGRPAVDPRLAALFCSNSVPGGDRSSHQLLISVIWRAGERIDKMGCRTVVAPLTSAPIRGQMNLLRYLYRLLPHSPYESLSLAETEACDALLDLCGHAMRPDHASCRKAKQQLESLASPPTSAMLCCAVWAALRQGAGDGALTQGKHVTKPLATWYNQFSAALIEEGGVSA